MRLKQIRIWVIAGSLAICTIGAWGYKANKTNVAEEVCKEQGKEQPVKKLNSSLPMWESISRHLIMAGNN